MDGYEVSKQSKAPNSRSVLASQLRIKPLVIIVLGAALGISLLLSLSTDVADARSGGIIDRSGNPATSGGASCSFCHGDTPATVTIVAPASVQPEETVQVSVTVSGGPAVRAGFNASFGDFAGDLLPVDATTTTIENQITHAAALDMTEGEATFNFDWVAPAEAGEVTLYVGAVSANGAGGFAGDATAAATAAIQVVAPAPGQGDVNCDEISNIVDALMIAQFQVGTRTDTGGCPLTDISTEINAGPGDLNGDSSTDIVDALLVAQCSTGIENPFCPIP